MGRTGAGRSPVPGASLVARMDQSNATRSGPTFRMNRFERSHTATSLRPDSLMGTTFGFFGIFDTVGRCSQEKSSPPCADLPLAPSPDHQPQFMACQGEYWKHPPSWRKRCDNSIAPARWSSRKRWCAWPSGWWLQRRGGNGHRCTEWSCRGSSEPRSCHDYPAPARRVAMNCGSNPWRRPSPPCSLSLVNTLGTIEMQRELSPSAWRRFWAVNRRSNRCWGATSSESESVSD